MRRRCLRENSPRQRRVRTGSGSDRIIKATLNSVAIALTIPIWQFILIRSLPLPVLTLTQEEIRRCQSNQFLNANVRSRLILQFAAARRQLIFYSKAFGAVERYRF